MRDITNITPPRVDFIDPRTGLIAREWYRFFLNLFRLTGSGSNDVSLVDVQMTPSSPELSELQKQDISVLLAQYDTAASLIEGLYLQPPVIPQVAQDDVTPRAEIGTIAAQNHDNVSITGGGIANVTITGGSIANVTITGGSVTSAVTDNTTSLIASSSTLANGAGALAGTLNNAPAAGNPTKWVSINDNGTTRYIPAW